MKDLDEYSDDSISALPPAPSSPTAGHHVDSDRTFSQGLPSPNRARKQHSFQSADSVKSLEFLENGELISPDSNTSNYIPDTIFEFGKEFEHIERSRHESYANQIINTAATKIIDFGNSLRSLAASNSAADTNAEVLSPLSESEALGTDTTKSGSRVVYLNGPQMNVYCDNKVTTAKYTKTNFIPRFFFERLSQTANFYFLLVGVGQLIPAISSTSDLPYQWIVLGIVICIDAVFAAIEDSARHRADTRMNARITRVFNMDLIGSESNMALLCGSNTDPDKKNLEVNSASINCFSKVFWKDIRVGDIVKIINYEPVPADLLLLAVSEPNPEQPAGICFVETKSLDGETNLKIRQALSCTFSQLNDPRSLGHLPGRVISELPNHDVNTFSGRYEPRHGHTIPIDLKSVALRGSVIRNTPYVYGVVLNTGKDTKIMQSSSEIPRKNSKILSTLNRGIGILMSFLLVLCVLGSSICSYWISDNYNKATYLYLTDLSGRASFRNDFGGWIVYTGYYWILIASFVPITLYVTIAIVKTHQTIFLNRDLAMYDEGTDTAALVRNADLNDDLGQITHIFSDKTGTLTANVMDFRKMSINGISYGRGTTEIGREAQRRLGRDLSTSDILADQIPRESTVENVYFVDPTNEFSNDKAGNPDQAARIHSFLLHLAVCHSVVLEQPHTKVSIGPEAIKKTSKYCQIFSMRKKNGSSRSGNTMSSTLNTREALGPNTSKIPTVASEDGIIASASRVSSILPLIETAYKFSASSPDELALVSAAKYFGYTFLARRNGSVSITIDRNQAQEEMLFEILEIIDFTSARKRMSVIIRTPERKILLCTKGADSALFPRLDDSKTDANIVSTTTQQLEQYASEGLRTLVLAQRELQDHEFLQWSERYKAALSDLKELQRQRNGERNRIDDLEDEIETKLELVGATAIEDRLQDHVSQTIADLALAGLKIWILTGDKEETAINIGFACRVLTNDMKRIIINSEIYPTTSSLYDLLYSRARKCRSLSVSDDNDDDMSAQHPQEAIVVDGRSLTMIFAHSQLRELFLEVSQYCCAVICCRVSPKQKAQVVRLYKVNIKGCRTLAIGDGANDVGMIQEAHVGIGISGHEGMQAVNASDFAIAQFGFLKRLLLVHGHWNYRRMVMLCLYCVYKNIILYCACFVLAAMSGGSGTLFFNNMWLNGYNLFWTSLPIAAVAILEQESSANIAESFPGLYYGGAQGESFNLRIFTAWILEALYEGVVCALIPTLLLGKVDSYGNSVTIDVCGGIAWCAMIMVGWAKLALNVVAWNIITFFSFVLSILFWYISAYIISTLFPVSLADVAFPYAFTLVEFYLVIYISLLLCLGRDFLYKAYEREFEPDYYHILQEYNKCSSDIVKAQWTAPALRYSHFQADLTLPKPDFDAIERARLRSPPASEGVPKSFDAERQRAYTGFAFSTHLEDRFINPLRELVLLPVVHMVDTLGHRLVDVLHSNAPLTREHIEASTKAVPFECNVRSLPIQDQVVYELQRYQIFTGWGSSVPGHLFVTDPPRFTNAEMTEGAATFDLSDFVIDNHFGGSDQWQYATKFKDFLHPEKPPSAITRLSVRLREIGSGAGESRVERRRLRRKLQKLIGRCVRRRRWVQKERMVQEIADSVIFASKEALKEAELDSSFANTHL